MQLVCPFAVLWSAVIVPILYSASWVSLEWIVADAAVLEEVNGEYSSLYFSFVCSKIFILLQLSIIFYVSYCSYSEYQDI